MTTWRQISVNAGVYIKHFLLIDHVNFLKMFKSCPFSKSNTNSSYLHESCSTVDKYFHDFIFNVSHLIKFWQLKWSITKNINAKIAAIYGHYVVEGKLSDARKIWARFLHRPFSLSKLTIIVFSASGFSSVRIRSLILYSFYLWEYKHFPNYLKDGFGYTIKIKNWIDLKHQRRIVQFNIFDTVMIDNNFDDVSSDSWQWVENNDGPIFRKYSNRTND